MQRKWFGRHGHSLGHTKPRGFAAPAELYFCDAEARLWSQERLAAAVAQATNAFWGLPIFRFRLHLAAEGPVLAIAAEKEFHRYDSTGERLWSHYFPSFHRLDHRIEITDLPTREARLSRLGLVQTTNADSVRTGYVRLALDTLMNAGWLKQVQVYRRCGGVKDLSAD